MPLLPVYDWLGLDFDSSTKRLLNVVGLALVGFVLVDAFVIHEFVWDNDPSLYYWLAKPVWVGIPMLAGAWWLWTRSDAGFTRSVLAGAVIGIVSLQLYYTVIPIPIDNGPAIQIGLVGNLTEGLVVHLGGLTLALVGALYVARRLR